MSSSQTTAATLPRHLVGVSLKSYFDLQRTTDYVSSVVTSLPSLSHEQADGSDTIGIFILPTFPALPLCKSIIATSKDTHVMLGAQNTHYADSGPFTGEVSPLVLAQLGCRLVCVGHAERRAAPFNESEALIADKVAGVIRNDMVPLVCIGEKNRPATGGQGQGGAAMTSMMIGQAVDGCRAQVESGLDAILTPAEHSSTQPGLQVVFAYEPVWAIGASEPAGAEYVCAVLSALKSLGKVREFEARGGQTRWLYGGSAGPGTWKGLKDECDGLFLGRFAHDVKNFVRTVEEVREQ